MFSNYSRLRSGASVQADGRSRLRSTFSSVSSSLNCPSPDARLVRHHSDYVVPSHQLARL
ncbi:hypothetical protein M513_11456 [Trichuris suis]|uniref:Uncharacterized protein n=1 Tax=Trichuris suis TaxID=68888 RepID=A0A085LRR9_9BILA|nr:hypothetical protein M513_11456 [Trichuris suis]